MNNSNVIRNISTDQSEILHNIMKLHNNGNAFECDITSSKLNFYGKNKGAKYSIPTPKLLFDVYPENENITKIYPFTKLPLEDNSIGSIVVDLPFVISPKTSKSRIEKNDGSSMIAQRFSSFYPAEELYENIYWWIKECSRVLKPNGICVWKMQSQVSGGKQIWSTYFSFMCAQKLGLYVKDEFILLAKSRLIPASKINKQCHARKYTSTFLVFKKDEKMFEKSNIFHTLESCQKQDEENTLEGKVWPLK